MTKLGVVNVQLLELSAVLVVTASWLDQARNVSLNQFRNNGLLLAQTAVVVSHGDVDDVQWLESEWDVVVQLLEFWQIAGQTNQKRLAQLLLVLSNDLNVALNESVQLADLLLQQAVVLLLWLVQTSLNGALQLSLEKVSLALFDLLLDLSQNLHVVLQDLLNLPLLLLNSRVFQTSDVLNQVLDLLVQWLVNFELNWQVELAVLNELLDLLLDQDGDQFLLLIRQDALQVLDLFEQLQLLLQDHWVDLLGSQLLLNGELLLHLVLEFDQAALNNANQFAEQLEVLHVLLLLLEVTTREQLLVLLPEVLQISDLLVQLLLSDDDHLQLLTVDVALTVVDLLLTDFALELVQQLLELVLLNGDV